MFESTRELIRGGRLREAEGALESALKQNPSDTEALLWLAVLRRGQGRLEEAVDLLQRLHGLVENNPESFNLLGVSLLSLGRAVEAESAFRTVLSLVPNSAPAYANLGMALRLQNRGPEALEAFQKALSLAPEHPQNHLQVFKQLQQMSRWDEAVNALENGVQKHPTSVPLAEALAAAYGRLNRPQEAEPLFRRVAAVSAASANEYALWLQDQGRFEDSVKALRDSIRLQPRQGEAYRLLVEARQSEIDGQPILDLAEGLLRDAALDPAARMHLRFALGKLYDRAKDYGSAMRSFDEANTIAYRTYPSSRTFDPAWTKREPELIEQLFSEPVVSSNDDPRPIFIVGMIRSGTTLLDQIVSAHPSVKSVGEGAFWNAEADAIYRRWSANPPDLDDLTDLAERYLKAVNIEPDARRFTDKMPLNYRNLGPILAAFPRAKVLHIRRDPFDTCLSIYASFFGGGPNFTYDQRNIVTFYEAYLKMMEHWRQVLPPETLFEIDYERLVQDPEPNIRSVIDFLDLPWDDACLHPEANRDQISTPSRWQARQPIYTSSVGKRQAYGPFAGALNDCPPNPFS